jgi:hypothetical protein
MNQHTGILARNKAKEFCANYQLFPVSSGAPSLQGERSPKGGLRTLSRKDTAEAVPLLRAST